MGLFNRKKQTSGFSREKALEAKPVHLPFLKKEQKDEKLYVTVKLQRPLWQRALGADKLCERTFGLDCYGQEVYKACGEDKKIKTIIDEFAKNHKLSVTEAEMAVTKFITTLITKGLIYVEVNY